MWKEGGKSEILSSVDISMDVNVEDLCKKTPEFSNEVEAYLLKALNFMTDTVRERQSNGKRKYDEKRKCVEVSIPLLVFFIH